MMEWIRFWIAAALVLSGLVVLCIGVFGVFRFRYAANRMHASAINDTLGLGLCLLGLSYGSIQWFGLCAVPLLALYNGCRGKWRIGGLFYLYYPLHLAVIYGISLLLEAVSG